ncbi:MAG: hypothetical protein K9K32_01850 [Halanaerobiales bacterium]|nr:hypothetical protein [Halanaerobiales bacterium]
MRNLLNLVKNDIKFQYKNGFYYIYLFIAIIYILILCFIPTEYKKDITIFIVLSDPVMLGFFFIGAIILFEKGDKVIEQLFVTPIKINQYIISKVISLIFLATSVGMIIVITSNIDLFSIILFVISLIMISTFFTLLGITLAVRIDTVNEFILFSIIYYLLIMLPFLDVFNVVNSYLFYLLPTLPSYFLLSYSIKGTFNNLYIWYHIANLLFWIVITYIWVKNWFYKYIILKIGDNNEKNI